MKIAILVHGFNVKDGGRATVGKLRPFFAALGIPSIMINYGHFGLFDTYWKNRRVAKKVAKACANAKLAGHEVIVVGHSNGCAIINRAAARLNAVMQQVVYINPALDADAVIEPNVGAVHVWHSPSDRPVKWAKWLPLHPWGEMGATGYTGTDTRVSNINKETDCLVSSKEHSDVFSAELLPYFGPEISKEAVQCLNLASSLNPDARG